MNSQKRSWTYILLCSDQSFYTGSTTDIDNRIIEHQHGVYSGYTKSRRPVKLVWLEEFATLEEAFTLERQIKGWSRAKKEALIRNDFKLIHQLAQSKEMKERRRAGRLPSSTSPLEEPGLRSD